jgi:hypothetical protein
MYPNPEVLNRERKCIRGGLPEEYVLVKEPGYVGSGGQHESLMANQDPDLGMGRDLCCVVSIEGDGVVTQASHATVQETTEILETTAPPLLVNPEPELAVPVEEAPPPMEEAPPPMEEAPPMHFHGHNHTNASNHSNHSNHSNASMWEPGLADAVLAYTRRVSDDGATTVSTEFEREEKLADGGFDFRDLARLEGEAAAVAASRGHLRAAQWR